MPYQLTITELRIEISVDSTEEWPTAFKALRPLMPSAPPRPPAPSIVVGSTKAKTANGVLSAHGQKRVANWLEVFRMLESSPNGIPAQEVGDRLGVASMNGIGRAIFPMKRMLAEQGLSSWDDMVVKARTDEGVIWRAGPKISQAIEIVEKANRPG